MRQRETPEKGGLCTAGSLCAGRGAPGYPHILPGFSARWRGDHGDLFVFGGAGGVARDQAYVNPDRSPTVNCPWKICLACWEKQRLRIDIVGQFLYIVTVVSWSIAFNRLELCDS